METAGSQNLRSGPCERGSSKFLSGQLKESQRFSTFIEKKFCDFLRYVSFVRRKLWSDRILINLKHHIPKGVEQFIQATELEP